MPRGFGSCWAPSTRRRRGTWALKVSGNWRVTFRFLGQEVADVDYEDYH
jgi:proteic killer suppression protein